MNEEDQAKTEVERVLELWQRATLWERCRPSAPVTPAGAAEAVYSLIGIIAGLDHAHQVALWTAAGELCLHQIQVEEELTRLLDAEDLAIEGGA